MLIIMLKTYYDSELLEVGIDEAGRGPMFIEYIQLLQLYHKMTLLYSHL